MGWNPIKKIKKAFKKVTKSIKKVAKNVWSKAKKFYNKSPFGKLHKGIWKGIKKVGSWAWKGIKKVGLGVMKVYGKLMKPFGKFAPLASLALSFMLPGIGTMLGNAWNGAQSWLLSSNSAILQTMGKGMQFLSNAASTVSQSISKGASWVKGKIASGWDWVKQQGGSLTDSISKAFSSAPDTAYNPELRLAENATKAEISTLTDAQRVLQANPELRLAANAQQRVAASNQSLLTANPELRLAENATGATNFGPTVTAEQTAQALADSTANRAGSLMTADQLTSAAKTSSLLETGKKLAKSLANTAVEAPYTEVPDMDIIDPNTARSDRFGISGFGAEGGFFLSDAQRMQQEIMRRRLAMEV